MNLDDTQLQIYNTLPANYRIHSLSKYIGNTNQNLSLPVVEHRLHKLQGQGQDEGESGKASKIYRYSSLITV